MTDTAGRMVLILTNSMNIDTVIGNEMIVVLQSMHTKMNLSGIYVDHQEVVPWGQAACRGVAAGGATMVGIGGHESEGQMVQWRPWEGYDDNFFYYLSGVD
jgi:hypothetical protein